MIIMLPYAVATPVSAAAQIDLAAFVDKPQGASSGTADSVSVMDRLNEPGTDPVGSESVIVVSAPPRPTPADPLEHVNIKTFEVMQSVDHGFVAPIAFGYRRIAPTPLRDGIHNLLGNLDEPIVFLNFLAQHKVGKATETFGRFAINSTLGVAGLFDVARKKRFRLAHRPNGFADTMGFYGIRPGPFFFLPLVGPTTLRDIAGGLVDRLVLPLGVGVPFNQISYTLPTGALKGLDHRLRFDGELRTQRAASEPYVSAREYYLARRQREIDDLRGVRSPTEPASNAR